MTSAEQHGVLTGEGGVGGRTTGIAACGATGAVKRQERQGAMRNQSFKGSTRGPGSPALLAGGGKPHEAACQERRAAVRHQRGREAIGGGSLKISNAPHAPPVALGAVLEGGGKQRSGGRWAVRRTGLQHQRVREALGLVSS
jgi:hypothetical protein